MANVRKVLPDIIKEIQAKIEKEKLDIKGYNIRIDTLSHSNGHNNHSDHTDVDSAFSNDLINPVERLG